MYTRKIIVTCTDTDSRVLINIHHTCGLVTAHFYHRSTEVVDNSFSYTLKRRVHTDERKNVEATGKQSENGNAKKRDEELKQLIIWCNISKLKNADACTTLRWHSNQENAIL